MTDRERLIEIVKNSLIKHIGKSCSLAENIVDDLLTEKVTFPPVAFSDNRRERMIELLNGYYEETGLAIVHYFTDDESEMLADYILSDGWIRPPCKVGDTVYRVYADDCGNVPCSGSCDSCSDAYWKTIPTAFKISMYDEIGKTVFLTKEEAEQELEKRGKENAVIFDKIIEIFEAYRKGGHGMVKTFHNGVTITIDNEGKMEIQTKNKTIICKFIFNSFSFLHTP